MSRSRSAAQNAPGERISIVLKQMAHAVMNGRKITLHVFDNEPCTGYPFGLDNDAFAMLIPFDDGSHFSRKLIPRLNVTRVDLHDESTFSSEKCYEDMEQIVRPFRDYLQKTVLGRQTSPSRR